MFEILFGWRKAAKCKKVIKRTHCRLKLLKNRINAIIRQSREDLAELIKIGNQQIAFNRVEQLIKDEDLSSAYELLDQFCQFILFHLSYIRRHRDCPNDINEAVSSLVYASARCGDLPELRSIRELFGHRYGDKFVTTALELSPGNLVNPQLKEKLSQKSVPDDVKYRVVGEIAKDYRIQPELLALEYYPDFQPAQVKENNGDGQLVSKDAHISDRITGSEIQPPEAEETESIICHDSSSKNSMSKSREYDTSNTAALKSTVQKYTPFSITIPLHKKAETVENFAEMNSFSAFGLEDKGEILALTSSAESLLPCHEEMIFYLDDIEEFQFSVSKDISFQDQRIFKFRSFGLPERKKIEFASDQSGIEQDELLSEKLSTRSSRKIRRAPEKRSRRRSTSLEKQGIMDIECMLYYYKPGRSPSAHKHGAQYWRKHQNLLEERSPEYSAYSPKKLKQHSSLEMEGMLLSSQSKNETNGGEYSGAAVYNVFTYQDCQTETKTTKPYPIRWGQLDCPTDEQTKEIKAEASKYLGSFASSSVSNTRFAASLTRTETEATYSRAVTMPPEQSKEHRDKMLRICSCPSQYPNHVHPKLPDYDDLAATFTALKRERLENKHGCSIPQLNRGGIVH